MLAVIGFCVFLDERKSSFIEFKQIYTQKTSIGPEKWRLEFNMKGQLSWMGIVATFMGYLKVPGCKY